MTTPRFIQLWTLWSFFVTMGAAACGFYLTNGTPFRAILFGGLGAIVTNIPVVWWRSHERARARVKARTVEEADFKQKLDAHLNSRKP